MVMKNPRVVLRVTPRPLHRHLASLVALKNKTLVFYIAHQLIQAYPEHAVSWFACGCYYFLTKRYTQARRFLLRAVELNPNFLAAWICYGHAQAEGEESDQVGRCTRTTGVAGAPGREWRSGRGPVTVPQQQDKVVPSSHN